MERVIGSMGSEYATVQADPEFVRLLTEKIDWNDIARRVFIDPVTGLIALMSPSSDHESYADGAGDLVKAIGDAHEIRVIALGSTRWRRREDPEKTGAEPDACYYLGARAEARARARHKGPEALAAFEADNPPDLVIEVERTHGDRRKPVFFREVGISEMWRLDLGPDGVEVDILDLQAADGPVYLTASAVLPHCTPDFVCDALELAVDGRRRELDSLVSAAASSAPEPSPFDKTGTME